MSTPPVLPNSSQTPPPVYPQYNAYPSGQMPPGIPPQKEKSRAGLWIGLIIGGIVVFGLIAVLLISLVVGGGSTASPGSSSGGQVLPTTQPAQPVAPTQQAPEVQYPTITPEIDDSNNDAPRKDQITIGYSVQGRAIDAYCVGGGSNTVIVVAGMHGGSGTIQLAHQLRMEFWNDPSLTPSDSEVCFIEVFNPDGMTSNDPDEQTFNANNVKLNRNWASYDWQEYLSATMKYAGGPYAMSEPENQALRDFIYGFGSDQVIVINLLQTTAAYSDVRPGTLNGNVDVDSDFFAWMYNSNAGFEYNHVYDYPITGQMIDWCVENGYAAFGVLLPKNGTYSFSDHLNGLLTVLTSL